MALLCFAIDAAVVVAAIVVNEFGLFHRYLRALIFFSLNLFQTDSLKEHLEFGLKIDLLLLYLKAGRQTLRKQPEIKSGRDLSLFELHLYFKR